MKRNIELSTVLKELYNISGFRVSIFDINMQEIAAYPKEVSGFCSLVQENQQALHICLENDAEAFREVVKRDEVYLYRCKFGLYEAVAPLYTFGTLSGYFMMGQTLDSLSDSKSSAYEKASRYVHDKKRLLAEIETLPQSSRSKILSCAAIMNICAEYITLSNRMNLTERNMAHEIKKYLTQSYSQKITLEDLSHRFFCSQPTLINSFKKAYHQTINQYLTQIRLNQAKILLEQSNFTIREIAEQCGFSDQNYFSKVFFRALACTPSQYRRKSQKIGEISGS